MTADTAVIDRYGVMGFPVAHSRSPVIHNLFARQTDQNMRYELLKVSPEHLEEAVRQFRHAGGKGLNITVPHKVAVTKLCDQLSERARQAGAVNTLVFQDDEARQNLEAILHPRIGAETRRQALAAPGPYQLIVVPLLVDSPLLAFVDRVLVVDCDEQTQLERLLARDAESPEQARRMLAAQASRKERLAIADDVIRNDDSLEDTRRQVARLDRRYRRFAARHRRRGVQ